jgi:hypothetical protein
VTRGTTSRASTETGSYVRGNGHILQGLSVDKSHVSVATMTWVRTPKEETLLRQTLTSLAACGLPVAVADSGTSRDFLHFLERLPQFSVTVPADTGLVAQIKASVRTAAIHGSRFILYTEPDKQVFFERCLTNFLEAASDHPDAGVILASRSPESLLTFPPMQRYTEGVINHLCGEQIGVKCDYSYGPFLLNSTLLRFVEALEATLGWGWRHRIFRAAHRQGLRVVPVIGDYPCPDDQRTEDDEEEAHRIRQLSQNVLGLIP